MNGKSDPLIYSVISKKLRIQILQIFDEANEIRAAEDYRSREDAYKILVKFFRKELGVIKLADRNYPEDEFSDWFLSHSNVEEVVDGIEGICRLILHFVAEERYSPSKENIRNCIDEINARILEANVGFQFEEQQILQVDSTFAHSEIVVPAIRLLNVPEFEGAHHEFMEAFNAFREGEYEIVTTESCKALESTLKIVFAKLEWEFEQSYPLRRLMKVAFENQLVPSFMETQFTGLRTQLEHGVGTTRNKLSAHGAGKRKRRVPKEIAAFQLHQTAAAIKLFVDSSASKSK